MIIEGKNYNGTCVCGREHTMVTQFCIVEAGCMSGIMEYIKESGLQGSAAAIYDTNTYHAEGLIRPVVDQEIILPAEGLHADNHGVALALEQLADQCDYLIAIGSGTIHDIVRYCAYQRNIPFVSCPTAASVDGFCSSVAAMTWDGFKKTFTAVAPRIVVADLNIISKAPAFLTNSGFGDMIGKFIALADWKIANILTGEYFCPVICDMTQKATEAVMESAEAIKNGHPDSYEKLVYGLLLSGLAMQLLGNSRCASGAEHHISHLIEMQPEGLELKSDALHGEKVGVGTLIACREYHRIRENGKITWKDYSGADEELIKKVFGEKLYESILKENEEDCGGEITAQVLEENYEKISKIIAEIPTYEELLEKYTVLGVKSTPAEIGVDEKKVGEIMAYSPFVRNRLTLMRLRRAMED